MNFDFSVPPGWSAAPLPQGGRGLLLQPPPTADFMERAALFLLDPLSAEGTLTQQLEHAVQKSLSNVTVLHRGPPQPLPGAAFPGLLVPALAQLEQPSKDGPQKIEEGRLYMMLDSGADRLLIVFCGGQRSLPKYQSAIDGFLRSIRPSGNAAAANSEAASGAGSGPGASSPLSSFSE